MIENKTVFITGANRGLGLEIARAFIEGGASVLLTGQPPVGLAGQPPADADVAVVVYHGAK